MFKTNPAFVEAFVEWQSTIQQRGYDPTDPEFAKKTENDQEFQRKTEKLYEFLYQNEEVLQGALNTSQEATQNSAKVTENSDESKQESIAKTREVLSDEHLQRLFEKNPEITRAMKEFMDARTEKGLPEPSLSTVEQEEEAFRKYPEIKAKFLKVQQLITKAEQERRD